MNMMPDPPYLEIISQMNSYQLCGFPIDRERLLVLRDYAVESKNIRALIGWVELFQSKRASQLMLEIDPFVSFFMVFDILSKTGFNPSSKHDIIRLVGVLSKMCFKYKPYQLQMLWYEFQLYFNLFERGLQLFDRDSTTFKRILIEMSHRLVDFLFRDDKKDRLYDQFEEYTRQILKCQKQHFLLQLFYEIEFQYFKAMTQCSCRVSCKGVISYFNKKLTNFEYITQPVNHIDHFAFVLRKLFIFQREYPLPENDLRNFDQQMLKQINLIFSNEFIEKTIKSFPELMRFNRFFDYIQYLFVSQTAKEEIKVVKNRLATRLGAIQHEKDRDDLTDLFVFFQLHNQQGFLDEKNKETKNPSNISRQTFNSNNSQRSPIDQIDQVDGFDFPFIDNDIVARFLSKPLLQSHGKDLARKIATEIEKGKAYQLFEKSNIVQKSIIFYYTHYYEFIVFSQTSNPQLFAKSIGIIRKFKEDIDIVSQLEILEFYLLEVQLGKYTQNAVSRRVYDTFIDRFNHTLLQYLHRFMQITETKEMKLMKKVANCLILLIKGFSPEFKMAQMCKNCKNTQVSESRKCNKCQHICRTVKLFNGQNPIQKGRGRYQKMMKRLESVCDQLSEKINQEIVVYNDEKSHMMKCWLGTLLL